MEGGGKTNLMPPLILGEHPLAVDPQGNLKCRIGTIFLRGNLLVTLPGIHATQRLAYSDWLNARRRANGLPPLTAAEESDEWDQSADLIMEHDVILIRPDPENMEVAFAADELLQELVSKQKIRFLNVMDELVRQAIKERGECWRISPLPQSPEEMQRMLRAARIGIGDRAIYYYSMLTGTRFLTCHEFARLGSLAPADLARHLQEIREYSGRRNRRHHPEIDFFGVDRSFSHADFADNDFLGIDPPPLIERHGRLAAKFRQAVAPELRDDDLNNLVWRNRMFSALIGQRDQTVAERILRGLSPEFFMQIQWLPGGRIEDGEFIFDPVFDELDKRPTDESLVALCDEKAKGFIFNFIRDFGDVDYLNIGRVASSLSQRPKAPGRRGVYLAEIKRHDVVEPVTRTLRLQKWDIIDHLEAGKDLLQAVMEAEEYTEYILDRRLGCRQLGMNVPTTVSTRRIYQPYRGLRPEYQGERIGFTYFEREYVQGVATDKIARAKLQSAEFARRLACLLGKAAASSLIVGKADLTGKALFDDGDEVLVEDAAGLPSELITCDPTGTFANYAADLASAAEDYARPVNCRRTLVPDPAAFAAAYLEAFVDQFRLVQQKYRSRKRGFDTLFKHRERDERGSFAYRWEQVLARLDRTDPQVIGENIRGWFRLE